MSPKHQLSNTPHPKKILKHIPLNNMMAMFFSQQPTQKTTKSESLIFLGSAVPTPRFRGQAPVFPAAFQPSCWGGAAILVKPKTGGKNRGGKVPLKRRWGRSNLKTTQKWRECFFQQN